MTLIEILTTIPDDEIVAVGSRTGYLYVGTKKHLEEIESKLSTALLEVLVNQRARALSELEIYERKLDIPQYEDETPEEYQSRVQAMKRVRDSLAKKVDHDTACVAEFTPLRSRDVKSVGKTPIYERTQIIVTGREQGSFWTQEEFEAWERSGLTSTIPHTKGVEVNACRT